MKAARFCPGYDVARTCDGRCGTCKHVIVWDLPPGSCPPRRRGQRLPVLGRIVVEELKITDTKRHVVAMSGVGSLVHPHGRLTLN
jgi:hypothetical protein